LLAVAVLAALLAATLRGPCRRAFRAWRPAERPAAAPATGAIAHVIDGDTVVTDAGTTIRLIGLDAPELNAPDPRRAALAREARDLLARIVNGRPARFQYGLETADRYGRTLAHVFAADPAGDRLVAEELLRQGLASVYLMPPNLGYRDRLVAAQREAVTSSRGIWSLPSVPEAFYVVGAYRFHRPSCPHAKDIPRPRRMADRTAILASGKGPCRRCKP
jgi:endonuclease YncB( thermonuclease family)